MIYAPGSVAFDFVVIILSVLIGLVWSLYPFSQGLLYCWWTNLYEDRVTQSQVKVFGEYYSALRNTIYIIEWDVSKWNLYMTWWRHQMETFPRYWPFVCGEFAGEFPLQRPMTRSFDVFFDLRLNKRLSKHSRRRWYETPSCSSWRHCKNER